MADPKTEETAKDKDKAQKKGASGSHVPFDRNFQIDFTKEIEDYAPDPLKAYEVIPTGNQTGSFYALICEPHLTPRVHAAQAYSGVANPASNRLVSAGVVAVPILRQQRYCFIYENNLGRPICNSNYGIALGWKPDRVLEKVVAPVMSVLKDFHNVDLVHGAICPTNMFNGGKEDFSSIIVGDCLSVPAFSRQPAIFESPDRMMATATGRGEATPQYDLYSLGVTLAMMLRSIDPLEGLTDDQIYTRKIQNGTYASMFSNADRFSGAILELLRGLMQDDPASRWTVDEALAWMDGRRLSPKQPTKIRKAGRALSMAEHEYNYPQTLVRDMFKTQSDAIKLIEGGTMEQWIERSIADEPLRVRYENACVSAREQGTGSGYHDRLLARVSVALDPLGPVRYKGVSVTADGVGTAMAEAFVQGHDTRQFAEMFSTGLWAFWMATLTDLNKDVTPYMTRFEAARASLRQSNVANGVERVLYILNDDVHCLSPILKDYHVRNPEQLLMAFDQIVQKSPSVSFIDPHVMGFLANKDGRMTDPHLFDLSSKDPVKRIIGLMKVFSITQKSYNIGPLEHLSSWCVDYVQPVIKRYHDREHQNVIKQKLEQVRNSGDLTKISELISTSEAFEYDMAGFRRAMGEFKRLKREGKDLEQRLERPDLFGRTKGRETAAYVGTILASFIIMIFVFLYMSGQQPF